MHFDFENTNRSYKILVANFIDVLIFSFTMWLSASMLSEKILNVNFSLLKVIFITLMTRYFYFIYPLFLLHLPVIFITFTRYFYYIYLLSSVRSRDMSVTEVSSLLTRYRVTSGSTLSS